MCSIINLLDKEDISYLTEQENILKTLQSPLLMLVQQISDVDLVPFKKNTDYHQGHFFLYRAEKNKEKIFDVSINAIEEIATEFVSIIEWYLEDKYDIPLELSLDKSFDFSTLSLQTVFSLIEKQLNGMTFQEKSIDALKQSIRLLSPDVEGKTIIIKEFFNLDYNGCPLFIEADGSNLATVFKGLAYFETGKQELTEKMAHILKRQWKEGEIDLERVVEFKTYKNGNLTVRFKKEEDAQYFVELFLPFEEIVG